MVVELKENYCQKYGVLRNQVVLPVRTLINYHKILVDSGDVYCCHDGAFEWGMMMVVDFVESYYWKAVVVVFVLARTVGLLERSGEESLP